MWHLLLENRVCFLLGFLLSRKVIYQEVNLKFYVLLEKGFTPLFAWGSSVRLGSVCVCRAPKPCGLRSTPLRQLSIVTERVCSSGNLR